MLKFWKRLLDQRGVIHLLPLLILLAGIIGGVYLVQKSGYQIFKPRAAGEEVEIQATDGQDANGNPCFVKKEDGKLKTNCPEVKIRFTSPLEIQGSSDAGPNMSLVPNIVKAAYAATFPNGYCKDDKSKIYYRVGSEEREARFCRSNEECTAVEGGADCVKTVEVGGRGWVCKDDTLHKDPDKIFFIPLPWTEQNISCSNSGLVCKQEGNRASCVAKGPERREPPERPGVPPSAPTNVSPKGDVNIAPNQQAIRFEWQGPEGIASYRILINAQGDDRVDPRNDCPQDRYPQYYICTDAGSTGGVDVRSSRFKDGGSYAWWVDAVDASGEVVGTSVGFDITIKKQAVVPPPPPRVVPPPPPAAPAPVTVETRCIDNPVTPPANYKWKTDCSSTCQTNADCPKSKDQFVCPSTSNWCYDFAGNVGKRCLKLEYIGSRTAPLPGPGGPACPERPAPSETKVTTCKNESKTWAQIDAELRGANYDGVYDHSQAELDAYNRAACPAAGGPGAGVGPTAPQQPSQRVTTGYRFAEDRTQLANLSFLPYTPGGVSLTHRFADPANGPHSILAQFQYNDSSSDLSRVFTVTIELVGPSAPATQPPPPPPAGGSTSTPCSQFETYNVCGGGVLTYDKCTDDKGQTGGQLCSGQATKFYCEGSGNSNCISDPTKQGNYSCSACPNLAGRASSGGTTAPLGIANCYVRPAGVNIGGSVTYQVLVQGGKPPYYFNLTGDFSKSVTSQTGTAEITQTFDSAGLKRVSLVVGSGAEQSSSVCPAVQVSSFDRTTESVPSSNIPAGSACSAYETTSVCGGGFKTYDKCTDNKGQTGSQLCLGGATTFYCVGSTNSNCDSSGGTGVGNYSCSGCPNLSNR